MRGSTEIATEACGTELGGTHDVRGRKGGPGEAVAATKERRGMRERRQDGMVRARRGLCRLISAELLGCGTWQVDCHTPKGVKSVAGAVA